ncbi:hypothetical protein F1735_33395 [Massilia sp. CCM 8694]|uniref:Uncharacterized protein n=2 Tax=Massilia genomosp. 1 TaxID=2609280 RepID=A0ABX0N6I2_9BURK|nr:hypothetical protein [Massilia genomosp. 1]
MNQQNGLYLVDRTPFSGAGFMVGAQREVRSFQMKDGIFAGAYRPLCADDAIGLAQLDVTGLLCDEENAQYPLPESIETFSGIGYEFQNGHCIHEILFCRGAVVCDCWWLKSGLLVGYNRIGDIYHHYDWYSSGVLKSATVSCGESFSGMLGFLEDGRLRALTLQGDFFSNLPDIFRTTSFFPVEKKEGLALLKGAESVYLSRNCIDDSVIELMATSGSFDETTTLKFNDTNIGSRAASILSALKNLKTLSIESPDASQRVIAENIMERRPDMNATFILTRAYPRIG